MRCPHCNGLFHKRNDIVVEYEGVPMSLRELSQRTGIAHRTIGSRWWRGDRTVEQLTRAPDPRKSRRGQE